MTRLGKKPIEIPEKTEVTVSEGVVIVKGPLGENRVPFKPVVNIEVKDGTVVLTLKKKDDLEAYALWGTYASLIKGAIEGVTKGFEQKLIIEGVGYRAEVKGNKLVLNIGLSHQVEVKIPEGIKVTAEKESITVNGINKQDVGQFTANIRANKKPEPYKGKGIRYADEIIRRKEGKKTV